MSIVYCSIRSDNHFAAWILVSITCSIVTFAGDIVSFFTSYDPLYDDPQKLKYHFMESPETLSYAAREMPVL